MGSLTDYAELELLDHLCNVAYSPVATVYLALATADPTDAATGGNMNECADSGSYARKAITFGAAASRKVTQNADVDFDQATGSWGTVTHWAIVTSATHGGGDVLGHGAFGESKSIVSGNTPSVASGQIYVEYQANEISNAVAHKLLDLMFRNQAYAAPDTYVGLVTVAATDSDTGSTITEPGAGAYARVQVNPNGGSSPTWNIAAAGLVDNTHIITFPTATASWGTIVGVVIISAAADGDLIMYDNTMEDQAVGTDDVVTFPVGDLDVQMS